MSASHTPVAGLTRVLVAVEGIDGSGKSGVARHIAEHFRSIGADVLATREPGGTPEGESLRALLLAGSDDTWDPYSELLLMTAARVQHVRKVIQPALDLGKTVVTDRFVGSTIAYQGAGRGIALEFIRELHETAVGGLWPQLTVILDLDTGTALARSRQRLTQQGLDEGRFEGLHLEFHEKIRQSFLEQARNAPERHVVVNAAGTLEQVQLAAVQAVMAHFAQRGSA